MTLQTGEKGFTVMELLAVIGIIIIITAAILTVIPGMRQKTQETATKALMERLEIAIILPEIFQMSRLLYNLLTQGRNSILNLMTAK
jgi:competence protein ComGC